MLRDYRRPSEKDVEDAYKPYALARLFVQCLFVSSAIAIGVWYVVNWLLDRYADLIGP